MHAIIAAPSMYTKITDENNPTELLTILRKSIYRPQFQILTLKILKTQKVKSGISFVSI